MSFLISKFGGKQKVGAVYLLSTIHGTLLLVKLPQESDKETREFPGKAGDRAEVPGDSR